MWYILGYTVFSSSLLAQYWDAISLHTCKFYKLFTSKHLKSAINSHRNRHSLKAEHMQKCLEDQDLTLLPSSDLEFPCQSVKEAHLPVCRTTQLYYDFHACTHKYMEFSNLQ